MLSALRAYGTALNLGYSPQTLGKELRSLHPQMRA
jgi:hypothetical protein